MTEEENIIKAKIESLNDEERKELQDLDNKYQVDKQKIIQHYIIERSKISEQYSKKQSNKLNFNINTHFVNNQGSTECGSRAFATLYCLIHNPDIDDSTLDQSAQHVFNNSYDNDKKYYIRDAVKNKPYNMLHNEDIRDLIDIANKYSTPLNNIYINKQLLIFNMRELEIPEYCNDENIELRVYVITCVLLRLTQLIKSNIYNIIYMLISYKQHWRAFVVRKYVNNNIHTIKIDIYDSLSKPEPTEKEPIIHDFINIINNIWNKK